jgi:hypothetical protein
MSPRGLLRSAVRLTAVFTLVTFCIQAPIAQAATVKTIYVSTSGNDSNNGSATAPLRTIQAAVNVAQPGDTVEVRAGAYPERVLIDRSGTSDAWLTVQAGEGQKVVTRGFEIGDTKKVSYVKVSGFEVTDTPLGWQASSAIGVYGDYITVSGNYIHHTYMTDGCAIGPGHLADPLYQVTNIVVENNTIAYCRGTGIGVNGTGWIVSGNDISHGHNLSALGVPGGDADGMRTHGSGHVIRDNRLHDFYYTESGAPPNDPHIDAFQAFVATNNLVFERNRIWNWDGSWFMFNGTFRGDIDGITIRNNVFESSGKSGYLSSLCHVTNVTVVSNTFVNAKWSALRFWGGAPDGGSTATVVNNIFYWTTPTTTAQAWSAENSSTVANDHNLCFPLNTKGFPKEGATEVGGLWGVDPKLVSPSARDFSLSGGSPARDSANGDFAPATDIEGRSRVDDPLMPNTGSGAITYADIGAFEGVASSPPLPPPASPRSEQEVYRLYNKRTGAYFWTASMAEKSAFLRKLGKRGRYEGVGFTLYTTSTANVSPVWRIYNKRTRKYYYTVSAAARDRMLRRTKGTRLDGAAFLASSVATGMPVYQIYNRRSRVYYYTADAAQRAHLMKKHGYRNSGVAFYLAP